MGDSASAVRVTSVVEALTQALTLTEAALLEEPADDVLERLVAVRAPWLAAAVSARGVASIRDGEAEHRLAAKLLERDAQLMTRLWSLHADSFKWVTDRNDEFSKTVPALSELQRTHPPKAPGAALGRPSTGAAETIHCYVKAGSSR